MDKDESSTEMEKNGESAKRRFPSWIRTASAWTVAFFVLLSVSAFFHYEIMENAPTGVPVPAESPTAAEIASRWNCDSIPERLDRSKCVSKALAAYSVRTGDPRKCFESGLGDASPALCFATFLTTFDNRKLPESETRKKTFEKYVEAYGLYGDYEKKALAEYKSSTRPFVKGKNALVFGSREFEKLGKIPKDYLESGFESVDGIYAVYLPSETVAEWEETETELIPKTIYGKDAFETFELYASSLDGGKTLALRDAMIARLATENTTAVELLSPFGIVRDLRNLSKRDKAGQEDWLFRGYLDRFEHLFSDEEFNEKPLSFGNSIVEFCEPVAYQPPEPPRRTPLDIQEAAEEMGLMKEYEEIDDLDAFEKKYLPKLDYEEPEPERFDLRPYDGKNDSATTLITTPKGGTLTARITTEDRGYACFSTPHGRAWGTIHRTGDVMNGTFEKHYVRTGFSIDFTDSQHFGKGVPGILLPSDIGIVDKEASVSKG